VTLTATLRHPASLRPSPHIHVQSFGRFDEILYLVEKTSALTLPDCRPLPHPCGKSESGDWPDEIYFGDSGACCLSQACSHSFKSRCSGL
jgi:hypothetical protein